MSPTAIREIMLLKELNQENIVRLDSVHITPGRNESSLCLAFDYAQHDLYEMIRYHRDTLGESSSTSGSIGGAGFLHLPGSCLAASQHNSGVNSMYV